MLLKLEKKIQKQIFSLLDQSDLTSLSCCNSDYEELMTPHVWRRVRVEYVKLLLPFRGSRLKHCEELYFFKGIEYYMHYQRQKYNLPPRRVVYGPPWLFWENFQRVIELCNPKIMRIMHNRMLLKIDFAPIAKMTNLTELYLHIKTFPDLVVDRICLNCPAQQIKVFSCRDTLNTDEAFKNIQRLKSVEKVELEGCKITIATVELVTTLSTVLDLSFWKSERNLSEDYQVKVSASMKQLEVLNVSAKRQKVSSKIVEDLSGLTALKELDISKHRITETDSKFFVHLEQLTKLNLAHTGVGDEVLTDLLVLKNLTYLDVSGCSSFTGTKLQELANLPLQVLSLSQTSVTNESFVGLSGIATLQKLDISKCCKLTDACIAQIIFLKSLQALNLSGNAITDEGLSLLSHIKNLQHLEIMECGKLTEDCTKHLLLLKSLRKLNICKTPLKYQSWKFIKDTMSVEMVGEWRPWRQEDMGDDEEDNEDDKEEEDEKYDSEDCDWWEKGRGHLEHGWNKHSSSDEEGLDFEGESYFLQMMKEQIRKRNDGEFKYEDVDEEEDDMWEDCDEDELEDSDEE